ncbi:CRISPR system precrRNA processing endoribonuclease RAMP protein Cas6 [Acidithiobacillus caldus]
MLQANSLIPQGSAAPHPWLLEPPEGPARFAADETFQFGFLLFGHAHAHLGLCLLAFRRAFAKGLGPRRAVLELEAIRREDEHEWSAVECYLAPPPRAMAAPPASSTLTIHFETPVRILRQKHVLSPDTLEFSDFFSSLQRRLGLLEILYEGNPSSDWDYRGALAAAGSCRWHGEALDWVHWERYSYRQERAMAWSGVVGRYRLTDLPARLWPVLYRGQWTHAGKNASFGYGRYCLTTDNFAESDRVSDSLHNIPIDHSQRS